MKGLKDKSSSSLKANSLSKNLHQLNCDMLFLCFWYQLSRHGVLYFIVCLHFTSLIKLVESYCPVLLMIDETANKDCEIKVKIPSKSVSRTVLNWTPCTH